MEFLRKEYNLQFRKKRFHAKSRDGCVQCKQYRTKCDELKPSCSRCTKRQIQCHYEARDQTACGGSKPSSSKSTLAGPSKAVSSLSTSSISAESQSNASSKHPKATSSKSRRPQQQPRLLANGPTPVDWEVSSPPTLPPAYESLLKYWRNNTSRIFEVPAAAHLARTIVVDIAMNNPFLLHAILSCGAVFKSLSMPYQTAHYNEAILEAAEHENLSMTSFRNTIVKVDQSNYEAVFMYTLIAALFVYTSFQPRLHNEAEERLHQLISSNWIRTLRAIPGLMGADCWTWLKQSPLFPFTYPGAFEAASPAPNDPSFQRIREHFVQLPELWEDAEGAPQTLSSADVETYRASHTLLLKTLDRVAADSSPTSSASSSTLPASVACAAWTVLVPTSFLNCLDRGTPQALLLLAHWGGLMSRITGVYWIEGFGKSVVNAVALKFVTGNRDGGMSRTIGDESVDWRKWMAWPMRMVDG